MGNTIKSPEIVELHEICNLLTNHKANKIEIENMLLEVLYCLWHIIHTC